MYKVIARMFDGTKQWEITIHTCKTFEEAEKSGYSFLTHYNNSSPTVLWLQVLDTNNEEEKP